MYSNIYCSRKWFRNVRSIACLMLVLVAPAAAQQASPETLQKIFDRLDSLERQNQELLTEIHALRDALKSNSGQPAAQNPQVEEQVNINTERIKEQATTKVESFQRFPLSLTGMFLFDSFLGTPQNSSFALATYDPYGSNGGGGGATLRQSIIGLDFRGPALPGGGKISGSLSLDFFAPSGDNDVLRIRRGVLSFDWSRRSITVGQDKSLIAPLQPISFARVGIPPLANAGNLWLWRPQIRYEERLPLSGRTQAALQIALLETDESYSVVPQSTSLYATPPRPAIQARAEVRHHWTEQSRVAIGFGFHESSSHILGQSAKSQVFSTDFLYKPFSKIELSGTLLRGENFANLGGASPGISVSTAGMVIPIRGAAGWLQLSFPLTSRLTLDAYAGRQLNNRHDLISYNVERTLTYAGNALYRVAPNVVLGFEASRFEFEYLNLQQFFTNRYDATFAYLF